MFLLSRPPYVRRAIAAIVVLVAVMIELRPSTTERLPVAIVDLPAGVTVTESDVDWIDVSPGLGAPVDLPAVLSRTVPAGAPVSAADVDPSTIEIPGGWLQIELDVPAATQQGATVVAVMTPSTLDHTATGLVTQAPKDTGFDALTALVAFEPSDAVAVARAVAQGTVTVLLGR